MNIEILKKFAEQDNVTKEAGVINDIKDAIDIAASHYALLPEGAKAAIQGVAGAGIGAGIGSLVTTKKKKNIGKLIGALLGGAGGASMAYLPPQKWWNDMVIRGIGERARDLKRKRDTEGLKTLYRDAFGYK